MATKRDRDRFIRGIDELLEARGARPSDKKVGLVGWLGGLYKWELETPQGLIFFTPVLASGRGQLGWVAGRFDNLAAGQRFGANPFSGKWNHHYFHSPVRIALEDFNRQLARVTGVEAADQTEREHNGVRTSPRCLQVLGAVRGRPIQKQRESSAFS